jgi:cell fate regulator YaaT (PSP1 superfamily)
MDKTRAKKKRRENTKNQIEKKGKIMKIVFFQIKFSQFISSFFFWFNC